MVQPDIVFIDTSVFIAENFFAPGNRINSLAKLAKEKKIRLVLHEITCQEIGKHIKSAVRQSWKSFNKDSQVFRNNAVIDKWRKTTNEKLEEEKITALFDQFLVATQAKILDYSYCSNVEKVFTDYFGSRKPFGEGQKKDEFPDAFVLTSLEKYSTEVNQTIVVLSSDGDMESYESKWLDFEDYGIYVSQKVSEGVALDEIEKKLAEEKMTLVSEIEKAVTNYLDDFRLYSSLLNIDEVTYYSVNQVIVDLNEDVYEVVSISNECIEIELRPEIQFKVDVDYVNYDYAFYDREDGQWYGTENETYEVDSEAEIKLTLLYYFGQNQCMPSFEIDDMELSALSDAIN